MKDNFYLLSFKFIVMKSRCGFPCGLFKEDKIQSAPKMAMILFGDVSITIVCFSIRLYRQIVIMQKITVYKKAIVHFSGPGRPAMITSTYTGMPK